MPGVDEAIINRARGTLQGAVEVLLNRGVEAEQIMDWVVDVINEDLTEHVENVVTKARADIETMSYDQLNALETADVAELGSGDAPA